MEKTHKVGFDVGHGVYKDGCNQGVVQGEEIDQCVDKAELVDEELVPSVSV